MNIRSKRINLNLSIFDKFPVLLATSTKEYGDMSQKGGEKAKENRKKFFDNIGILPEKVHIPSPIHEGCVAIANSSDNFYPRIDGLVTNNHSVFLSIKTADCPAIFFFDPKARIIGLTHGGWKNLKAGAIKNIVQKMIELQSCRHDILVGIGPFICTKCYEVGTITAISFSEINRAVKYDGDKINLSLLTIITYLLKEEGILTDKIDCDGRCTYQTKNLFSARRDGNNSQMGISIFGMKEDYQND